MTCIIIAKSEDVSRFFMYFIGKKEFNSDSFYKEIEINHWGPGAWRLSIERKNCLHLQFSQTSG